jgi:hypothetical protein
MPLREYRWEGMGRPGLASLAFAAPALAARLLWHPTGWLPLAATAGACWLAFAACAWRVAVNGEERARWGRMLPGLFGRTASAGAGGA